jgi:two-component system, OmpR family, sensor kinase
MSVRLRLTLWYVLLLAVILIIFGGALYAILAFSSLNQVDSTLERRAAEVQNGINAALAVQSEPRIFLSRGRLTLPPANVFATPGVYVQVSTLDGTPVTLSENLGGQTLSVPSAVITRVIDGDATFTNTTNGDVTLRIYASPLVFGSQTVGIILVGQSLQGTYETLARLATLLGIGILLGLLLAAIGGAFLADRALAPIERITLTAESITHSNDLTRRIEEPKSRDEVGRLAATFNEMLVRIDGIFRAQQQFVGDVSHELRSPLTAIRGNLDLLRRGAADDANARQEALAAIDSESARMQRLVSDLLLLAQAEAGFKIRKERVELDTILLDVFRQARAMAKGVTVNLAQEDQAQVIGDADRLKQLLMNLVDNAIKYTPAGGTVTMSLVRDAGAVRIAIKDTGIGIPSQDLERIFDRFYRVDKARPRGLLTVSGGGTGLGLAIAKWIAETHGGKIQVESQPGKGSTFTVSLPLAP